MALLSQNALLELANSCLLEPISATDLVRPLEDVGADSIAVAEIVLTLEAQLPDEARAPFEEEILTSSTLLEIHRKFVQFQVRYSGERHY